MTLNERYRIHNKSKSNKSLFMYLVLFAFLIFSSSLARYTNQSNATLGLEFANWCIEINGIKITPDTKTINNKIDLIVTENKTQDGLIKPGQKGYFDININPQYTEVSLKYKILIDTSDLPSEIKLKNYSINNSETKQNMPANKTLSGNILLDGKASLNETDNKKFRIYWEWASTDSKIENIKDNYKIKANIQLEQMIEE